jgi:TM2 domain-containing membrane protein YozV
MQFLKVIEHANASLTIKEATEPPTLAGNWPILLLHTLEYTRFCYAQSRDWTITIEVIDWWSTVVVFKLATSPFFGGHRFWESSLVYAIIYVNIIWLNFYFMCVHLNLIFTWLEYEINAWNHCFFQKHLYKKNAPMYCTS